MTEWKMITIPVEVHEKLMILKKEVLSLKSVGEVIIYLLEARDYDDAFFERIQEKIHDECA